MDEAVMLDYWNGRPSVWISSAAGQPFLHWMVLGHTEDVELWLHARLSWDLADRLVTDPPDTLADALALIGGVPVRLVLEENRRPILIADAQIPVRGASLANLLGALVTRMDAHNLVADPDRSLIDAARRDVDRLVAA